MDGTLTQAQRATVGLAVERAKEHGVALRIIGDQVNLEFDGRHYTWSLTWSADGSVRDVVARVRRDTFLLAERLSPSAADIARKTGACFADARGNLYVRAPGLLVDIRGRHAPTWSGSDDWATAKGIRAHSAPRSSNLMSAARAQVVFCLLQWPDLLSSSVRLLAHTAGVSVGSAQATLTELENDRHLTVGRTRLTRRGELLDQWAAAFSTGMGRKLELARFVGEPTPQAWAAAGRLVHVSGEYAADGITGSDLTLYVAELDSKAVMASRWRKPRSADGEEANIVIRRRFWQSPDLWGEPEGGDVQRAPELLVYADLLASGEPRQREVAGHLRDRLA